MKPILHRAILLLPALGYSNTLAGEPASVALTPLDEVTWHITFSVTVPTTRLKLIRTPDDSRRHRWNLNDDEFVLVHDSGSDWIRRRDDALFSEVTAVVPATYVPLPKEYAPFSPYQDGGLLIFTGRYHACSGQCSDDAPDTMGPWKMRLTPPTGASLIVNGTVYDGLATWLDTGAGTKVYVGPAQPAETDDFVALVDSALPQRIRTRLNTLLPALMAYYAERLEPPRQKPMLFASYDPDYPDGSGHQGGTLPGQVFVHFYGTGWSDRDPPGDTNDPHYTEETIAFFFAHEAAHLFQGQDRVRPENDIAWIHEGGADALALLALMDLAPVAQEYLKSRKRNAFDDCASGLGSQTLDEAAAAGDYQYHYSCGMLMNLAIDAALRRASNGQRGLFDFWSTFLDRVKVQADWTQENFLNVLRADDEHQTAAFLQSLTDERQARPREALRRGLASAGVDEDWLGPHADKQISPHAH